MNRTKRIQNILKKNFLDFDILVTDDSFAHKGHNNFDGKEETHIIIELKKKSINAIQNISTEIVSNIIENISGDKLNESSIKATVEDVSKKNLGKYL